MSLLQPLPEPASRRRWKRAVIPLVAVMVAVAIGWWLFRFYPEKRLVERFLDTVVAGDFRSAYEQWKPGPEYSFDDFVRDWGRGSDWGTIRGYEIKEVRGKGGVVSFVIVINGVETNPVELWVQRKAKSLSFAPPHDHPDPL